MNRKRNNGLMTAMSLAGTLAGWLIAEGLVAGAFKDAAGWPAIWRVGAYMGIVGLCASSGAVVSELLAKRYENSRNPRVFRKCVFLCLTSGALCAAVCGGLIQFLYGQEPGMGAARPDIVFLMDTSGSMDGILEQSIEAVNEVAGEMDKSDQAMVIQFSDSASVVVPFSPMDDVNRNKLSGSISRMTANGGTNFDLALSEALKKAGAGDKKARVIFMLTDGNAELSDPEAMAKKLVHANISVYAVGFKVNSVKNRDLKRIAEKTGGSYQTVDSPEQIKKTFVDTYLVAVKGRYVALSGERANTRGLLIWQAGVRCLGFMLIGSVLGLAYSFIPNKKDVIFRNGIQGLAAGIFMQAAFALWGEKAWPVCRLASLCVMSMALCAFGEEAPPPCGYAPDGYTDSGKAGWGTKDVI